MKGISVLERHFEKGVLALVLLGIGSFVAYDALFAASHVKAGGKDLGVAEVGPELKKESDAIAAAQGGSEIPFAIPEVPADEKALAVLDQKPFRDDGQSRRIMPSLASGLFSRAQRPIPIYHQPSFGPVRMVRSVVQSDGAVKVVAGKDEALVAFLDRRPAGWEKGETNVIFTTPAAEVDVAAFRAELERAEPEAQPPRERLPMHWWQQRDRAIWILDVIFEREEQQADGSWSGATVVESLPGVITFRGQQLPNAGAIADLFRKNPDMQKRILQAPCPTLAQGTPTDPLGGEVSAPESKELRAARKRVAVAQKALLEAAAALEKAGGEYSGPLDGAGGTGAGAGGSGGAGGAGGGGGKSGGGGFGPGKGGGSETDPDKLALRSRLTKQRDQKSDELKKCEEQVAALLKKAPAAKSPSDAKAVDASADRLVVWAHDFQVRPGATYRYRCRLQVANPFLGRKLELQDSQKELASAAGILTEPSEWAIVHVRSPREFFVVEGLPGERASDLARARFELFRLDKGMWCSARDLVEVGDRVGLRVSGAQGTSFAMDWYVIAVFRDLALEAEARRGGDTSGERKMVVVLANSQDHSQIMVRRPVSDLSNPDRDMLEKRAAPPKGAADSSEGSTTSGPKKS